MVPSGRRRYIYYFEAMVGTTFGTTRAILEQVAATGAAAGSVHTTRGEQAWFPDELKENSLPLAIIEASCRSRLRATAAHTVRAKILYVEGV